MQLTPSQLAGVEKIHALIGEAKSLLALSGPAGSGKTTIINALLDGLDDTVVCTPTNKAAQVLISKSIPAQTFFKTFYILEEKKRAGVKPKFISCRRYLEPLAERRGVSWEDCQHLLPEGKRTGARHIVIDEGSMVSTRMAHEMRGMCEHLILVGDRHQLPPVGDMDTPAGFFSSIKHDVELTEVLRQAEGSMILQLATEIRNASPKAERALRYFEPESSFENWVHQGAKMICFTNKERQRINHVTRTILGFTDPWPMPGDQVICTNNYSDDLINGTEARVLAFEWDQRSPTARIQLDTGMVRTWCRMSMKSFIEDQIVSQQRRLTADWEGGEPKEDEEFAEITFAYCLTAHKAQGSEWPAVVVFDQRGLVRKVAENDKRSGMTPDEYVRRWIYTAVTRARQHLAVAPTWWAQASPEPFSMD